MFRVLLCLWGLAGTVLAEEPVKLALMFSSGTQRIAFHQVCEAFREAYGVEVEIVTHHERYKKQLVPMLQNPDGPDVVYWQAGPRLEALVQQQLVDPLDDLWAESKWLRVFPADVIDAVRVDGSYYGLPFSRYHWSFYYHKPTFAGLGLEEPQTWDAFVDLCSRLDEAGLKPLIVPNEMPWMAAAWFGYFCLRLQGLEFYQSLMKGKIAYSDERVRQLFEAWLPLVERGYFIEMDEKVTWDQGMPLLYRKRVGMMLMGGFIAPNIPQELQGDVGQFAFPQMNETVAQAEMAPLDVFVLSKQAKRRKAVLQFLAFLGRPEVQSRLNESTGMLPPHLDAMGDAGFGSRLLRMTKEVALFVDRDLPSSISEDANEAFADFVKHGDIDKTIDRLESLRQRAQVNN